MPKADGALSSDEITKIVSDYKTKYNIGSTLSLARHFDIGAGIMQKGIKKNIWSRQSELKILKRIKKIGE